MNKNTLRKWADPLIVGSVVLYLVALCYGLTDGVFPYVCLLLATCALTVTLLEAVINKHSVTTLLYRLVAFFICWAGIFANQKQPVLESICAMIAMVGVIVLVLMFVYYINTKNTRDAENFLND